MTPPPRRRGETYRVGDIVVVVMACDVCGYLLPVAPGRAREYVCIVPDCEGTYRP